MIADGAVEVEDVLVVELIEDLTAFLAVGDEAGGPQGTELVGDGGFRGRELGGEVANAVLGLRQKGDQTQSGGIGEDGEEFRHALRILDTKDGCWLGVSGRVDVVLRADIVLGNVWQRKSGTGHLS